MPPSEPQLPEHQSYPTGWKARLQVVNLAWYEPFCILLIQPAVFRRPQSTKLPLGFKIALNVFPSSDTSNTASPCFNTSSESGSAIT